MRAALRDLIPAIAIIAGLSSVGEMWAALWL